MVRVKRKHVTDQDSVRRANGAAPEHGADPLPEIHCHATTRAGQPCRNRPLEGQNYCRIHAPLDGAASAAPSQMISLTGGTDDQELPNFLAAMSR